MHPPDQAEQNIIWALAAKSSTPLDSKHPCGLADTRHAPSTDLSTIPGDNPYEHGAGTVPAGATKVD